MKLTSFTDYTLRVLIYVALDPQRRATISGIATAYDISENHLTKVVHQLARSGLIQSMRGKGGGIQLAQPAENIRIGQVVNMAEGESPIVECLSDHDTCKITPACKLAGILTRARKAFYEELDRFTVADLIERPEPLNRILDMPQVPAPKITKRVSRAK
jgi:Rrf2 family nitric oxide-sensitive transcriptional repressor